MERGHAASAPPPALAVGDRGRSFAWKIAARYLTLPERRSSKLQLVSGIPLALFILAVLLSLVVRKPGLPLRDLRLAAAGPILFLRIVFGVAWVLLEVAILNFRRLSIFTTISTYGLFLGTAALILALSIMSGFEQDLKHKILGMHAHLDVTRDVDANSDADDSGWEQKASARVARVPGVVAVTTYLSNEAIISSASSVSPVVIKGIDPDTAGKVTDLERDIDVGDLHYLSQPEKLRALGGLPGDLLPPPTIDLKGDTQTGKTDGKQPAASPQPRVLHDPFFDSDDKTVRADAASRRVVPGIIIGRELARSLRVYLGDDVNIISPFGGIGPSGAIPKSKPFRVAGIFFSGMFEYDNNYVYIALPDAEKFFSTDEVTGLEVKVADPDDSERAVALVSAELGKGFVVEDWKSLNRALFSALKLEKIAMFIVLSFIILVSAFSIVANGIMLVLEKGREIAILKSMGASDGQVLSIFLLLGTFIGALGTVLGVIVGVSGCWALGRYGLPLDTDIYYITSLPVHMNWHEVVVVVCAAMGIALLATLYPAWQAARIRPVDGLRR